MNLTFGICWIEDQASEAEVEAVEEAVRSKGFEPEIERIESEDEIREFAERQQHFHDYDLILLDLRLGKGIRGNEIAPNVRTSFRSTPILFYSAEAEDRLRGMMCEKRIEGVYCVHRGRLAERVGELVEALSPALNRLSSMRGLAARVVAECDQESRAILRHLAQLAGREAEFVASLKGRVNSVAEKAVADVAPIDGLGDLLDRHEISSGILFNEMRDRVRNEAGSDDTRMLLRSLREYPNAVLNRRNTLAHALEERTATGWVIRRRNARSLTVADFQRYRRDFLSHLRDLRRLRELLVGEEA